MTESGEPWYVDIVMPALLTAARRGYGQAMRAGLASAGYTDVPPRGMRLLGGIARNGPAGPDIAQQLGVREAAAAKLVAALVAGGYITSGADGDGYVLTERGRSAATTAAEAAASFEDRVRSEVGAEQMAVTRAVLGAMVQLSRPHRTD